MRTFLDTKNTGMYLFLEEIEKSRDELVGDSFIQKWSGFGSRATKDQVAVWRALKGLTGGMVKTIVMSVGSGHEACHKHWRDSGIADGDGGRMKMVRDLTDHGVSDMHARSVLSGILDPTKRQHTTNKLSESFEVFKNSGVGVYECGGHVAKRMCQSWIPCRWKVLQVQYSVQGQYKSPCVSAVKHVEVVVIRKGRTLGLLGHMLVATTIVRQKGGKMNLSKKGVALGKGLSKGGPVK